MESRLWWFCNLEAVRDHQPDSVLWYQQGCERGPLIYPAGYTPAGACIRIGTIGSLVQAMQQALATDPSLRESLQRCDAVAVYALCNEQGTSYCFWPARLGGQLASEQAAVFLRCLCMLRL